MKIIYPPLVEQGYQFYKENKLEGVSRSEIYRFMVENHLIYENGSPTQEAIEKGYIKDFYEPYGLSLDDFFLLFPIFKNYKKELFQKVEGFWEIPISLKEKLIDQLESGKCNYEEKIQIEEFLNERE